MNNKTLKDIILDTDKQVGSSKNALAKLYRTILLEKGIGHSKIDHYLVKYLDDPMLGAPKSSKDRSSERGNLLKQLGKDAITWKIFLKGLRLLRPKRIRITIAFTDQLDETTVHSVDIEGYADIDEDVDGDDDD